MTDTKLTSLLKGTVDLLILNLFSRAHRTAMKSRSGSGNGPTAS